MLERTAWHSGQHCRQVELLLKEKLSIISKVALNESLFAGLPMPSNIWDNERSFSESSYDGQVKEDLSIKVMNCNSFNTEDWYDVTNLYN